MSPRCHAWALGNWRHRRRSACSECVQGGSPVRRDSKASARAAVTSAESSQRFAVAAEQSLELSWLDARRRVERTDVECKRETQRPSGRRVSERRDHDRPCGDSCPDDQQPAVRPHLRGCGAEWLIEHEASDLFHHAAEQDEVNIRDASSAGIALVSGRSLKVTERLSWRSGLGTPSIWTL